MRANVGKLNLEIKRRRDRETRETLRTETVGVKERQMWEIVDVRLENKEWQVSFVSERTTIIDFKPVRFSQ